MDFLSTGNQRSERGLTVFGDTARFCFREDIGQLVHGLIDCPFDGAAEQGQEGEHQEQASEHESAQGKHCSVFDLGEHHKGP